MISEGARMKTSNLLPEECKKEIRNMIVYMKKGLQEKTHQASGEEVQAGIASLEWVLKPDEKG